MSLLYAGAGAIAFPSRYEGAGLPVLESLGFRKAIVASDIPAVREFAGDAALYCDSTSANAFEYSMLEVERNTDIRLALEAQAGLRAQLFTRAGMADRLSALYLQQAHRQ